MRWVRWGAAVHVLTTVHAVGSLACASLAVAAVLPEAREALAISPGARLMMGLFGRWTTLFLAGVATLLAVLAYGSWRRRPWAWGLTLACYGVGVAGSLWEVAIGIEAAWLSAAINAGVVALALHPKVRAAYRAAEPREPAPPG